MTDHTGRDADWLNANLRRGPFHRWLGLRVVAIDHAANSIEIRVPWREEFTGSPDPAMAHGGILAALVDVGGFFLVAGATGRFACTVDLRTDYHRAAAPGDLTLVGRLVKAGRTLISADIAILDAERQLVASGRIVMMAETPLRAFMNNAG